jgi:hypothetical protein
MNTDNLEALLREERKAYKALNAAESYHAEVRMAIKDEMEELELESFRDDDIHAIVSYTTPKPSYRLDRALLVQNGVTPDIIAKSSREVKKSPYISIRAIDE